MQFVHEAEPVRLNLPGLHDEQFTALPKLNDPGSHAVHELWPSAFEYVPSLHAAHELCPVALWYRPVGQSLHSVEPSAVVILPEVHASQLARPVVSV